MKKLLIGLLSALVIVSPAWATILVNESFTHPDGNLVGQVPTPGPGVAWAQTGTGANGPVQVVGGKAVVVQNASSLYSQDVNVGTGTAMAAGDRWYASFDVSVTQVGATISNVYFAHFIEGTSNFVSRLWVTAPTTSGFRFALSNDSSITDVDGEVFSDDLALDTTYRLVVSYDYTGQNGSLWINPANESSPSLAATDPGFSNPVFGYALRQGSPSSSHNTTQTVDNLCVATTFMEALTCVPEPSTAGFLLLGGLLLRRRS